MEEWGSQEGEDFNAVPITNTWHLVVKAGMAVVSVQIYYEQLARKNDGVWCAWNGVAMDFEREGGRGDFVSHELPNLVHAEPWHHQ